MHNDLDEAARHGTIAIGYEANARAEGELGPIALLQLDNWREDQDTRSAPPVTGAAMRTDCGNELLEEGREEILP